MTIIGLVVVWDDGAVVLAGTGWSRRGLLRMLTKQQYRKLMNEYQATGNVTNSVMKWAMSRPTARKYVAAAQVPQALKSKHGWRTRKDPLVEIWPQAETLLAEAQDLEAGRALQLDWTNADELGITIAGEPYAHPLCHCVLSLLENCCATHGGCPQGLLRAASTGA